MVLQFEVETKCFDRFKKSFTTDRYFSVTQWEEVISGLNKVLAALIRQDSLERSEKGLFVADDSFKVLYEVAKKSTSYVNFNKLDFVYEFDWILLVKIEKLASGPVKLQSKAKDFSDSEFKTPYSVFRTRYQSTTIKNEASMSMQAPLANSPDYGNDKPLSPIEKLPVTKVKSKTKKVLVRSKSEPDSDCEVVSYGYGSKKRLATPTNENDVSMSKPGLRSHKKIKPESNQPTLMNFSRQNGVKLAHSAFGNARPAGSKEKKASTALNNGSSPLVTSGCDSTVMQRMEKFIEESNLQSDIKQSRMEKLKDTKILTCSSLSREELKKFVQLLGFH